MSLKKLRQAGNNAEVDMTPMLDIVFILLIFFIVTTSFIREEGILVNMPKNSKPSNVLNPSMVFTINETGIVSLNGKIVDIERIPARIESFIAKYKTDVAVVIPSVETSHANVMKVLDSIKTFRDINISIGR